MSLSSLIQTHFFTVPGEANFEHIYTYSVSYIVGGYTAFEYQKLLKGFCSSLSPKKFRLLLVADSTLYFRLKLYLLDAALQDSSHYRPTDAAKFGVDSTDARAAFKVLRVHATFRKNLKATAKQVTKVFPLSAAFFQGHLSSILAVVLPYIKSISYRKLRFIAKSTNCELSDLHSELSLKAVQVYYKLMPIVHTVYYIANYLRRSIHNHAMNLISENTSKKNGRLVNTGIHQNEQTFSLLVVSENQLNKNLEEGQEVSYDTLTTDEDTQMAKFELRYSIVELLDKYKSRSKKYRYLLLLLGDHDEEFSEWLAARKVCRAGESNTEVQLKLPAEDYRSNIRKFLHVGQEQSNVFELRVKRQLGFRGAQDERKAA